MKNKILVLLTLCVSFTSVSAFADQRLELKSDQGEVEFLAKGPLVRVNGKGEGPVGKLKVTDGKASGTLVLNLKSLNTGISLRDDHMKNKYLQVEKHPLAKLQFENIDIPKKLKGKAKFRGRLSLHGVTKEVSGTANFKGVRAGFAKVSAEFKIKFSDFGIELPSFKLVSVGEDIKIKVNSKAALVEVSKKEKTASL